MNLKIKHHQQLVPALSRSAFHYLLRNFRNVPADVWILSSELSLKHVSNRFISPTSSLSHVNVSLLTLLSVLEEVRGGQRRLEEHSRSDRGGEKLKGVNTQKCHRDNPPHKGVIESS